MAESTEVLYIASDDKDVDTNRVAAETSAAPKSRKSVAEAITGPTDSTRTPPAADIAGPTTLVDNAPVVTNTLRSLFDRPEVADRYTPILSTLEDVTYRDAQTFSIKPPHWYKWSTHEYRAFAQYLELVDLTPLSRILRKPVEEVYYMYHVLVLGPLYDQKKAAERGEGGMMDFFELFNKYGTPNRAWTARKIRGELDHVTTKTIHLTLEESGNKLTIGLHDLTDNDVAWIRENVSLAECQVLTAIAAGQAPEHETDDGLPPPARNVKRNAEELQIATPRPTKRARSEDSFATPSKRLHTYFEAQPARVPQPDSSQPSAAPSRPSQTPSSSDHQPVTTLNLPSSLHSSQEAPSGNPLTTKLPVSSPKSFIFRKWTNSQMEARFIRTTVDAVVLLQRQHDQEITVSVQNLTESDKTWMRSLKKEKLIDQSSWNLLVSSRKKQVEAARAVQASDTQGENDAGGSVATCNAGAATLAEEPYENIVGSPKRRWTDCNLIGKLAGLSTHKVFLDIGDGRRLHELPMSQWSQADKTWIKHSLSHDQLKVVSGKKK